MSHFTDYSSPPAMTLQASSQGLLGVWFATQTTQPEHLGDYVKECPILNKTIRQLDEYFFRSAHSIRATVGRQRHGISAVGLAHYADPLWGNMELSTTGRSNRQP